MPQQDIKLDFIHVSSRLAVYMQLKLQLISWEVDLMGA